MSLYKLLGTKMFHLFERIVTERPIFSQCITQTLPSPFFSLDDPTIMHFLFTNCAYSGAPKHSFSKLLLLLEPHLFLEDHCDRVNSKES